jgi:hypothetical protein
VVPPSNLTSPYGEREPRGFDRAGMHLLDGENLPRRMHPKQEEADKKESREVKYCEWGAIIIMHQKISR